VNRGTEAVSGDPINRNRRISELYALMYNDTSTNLRDPDGGTVFRWSGMAALASQLVGSGMAQAQTVINEGGLKGAVAPMFIDPSEGIRLLAMGNMDIFMNIYPQMLAYKSGGMAAIQGMLTGNDISRVQFNAWQKIADGQQTGNQQLVWDGNIGLLDSEQRVIAQNGAYAAHPAYWVNVTNSLLVPLGAIPALTSPIPGDPSSFQTFRATPGVVDEDGRPISSTVGINDFNARWAWIIQRQMPAYKTWSNATPQIDVKLLLKGGYK